MKIAMWSGPRNLSTALMYSFANRADTSVIDEPFYASYLTETGFQHPMREEVIASQATDPETVIKDLMSDHGAEHQYQKHMTQHMLPTVSRDWLRKVKNVFLIRHPARVLASWSNKHDELNLTDIGFVQQLELFEMVERLGHNPVVIDSADIRSNPETSLRALCEAMDWSGTLRCLSGKMARNRSMGFGQITGMMPCIARRDLQGRKQICLCSRVSWQR